MMQITEYEWREITRWFNLGLKTQDKEQWEIKQEGGEGEWR